MVSTATFSRETVKLVSVYEVVLRGRMVSDIVPKLMYRCTIHDPGVVGHRHRGGNFVQTVAREESRESKTGWWKFVALITSIKGKAAMCASDHVRKSTHGLIEPFWLGRPIKSI